MHLRIFRLLTLLMTGLAMTMESAHVLELPAKMQYIADFYTAVNGTLYRYFAIVGSFYQVTSLILLAILVYLTKNRGASFHWSL